MGSTGQICQRSGIYQPVCGDKRIALSEGGRFPPCAQCRRAVNWTLVIPT